MIVVTYIPLRANAKLALEELYCLISSNMNTNPEAAVIVAGDFNHMELKAVLPKLHKFINFPTRDNNILNQVYCKIPVMLSDHISVKLIPPYRLLICRSKPTSSTIQVRTEEGSSALQDCFEHTNWNVFKEGADLEQYTSPVLSYINFCTDAVLPTKTIMVFPNQKSWVDSTVRALLKVRDAAYSTNLGTEWLIAGHGRN